MKIANKLKQKCDLLKSDKLLLMILFLHLVLALCHFCHSFMSAIRYHGDLRTAGCLLIVGLIFFMGRKGMAYGFLIYACCLIYVNNFYNYASIFLLLIAIGAFPKIQKPAIVIYLINMAISFSLKKLLVFSAVIHVVYLILFFVCMKYVYKVNTPEKLSITEDERKILEELKAGKLQKEIDLFSPQTITAKLKSARERNMCETTAELLAKYTLEKESKE